MKGIVICGPTGAGKSDIAVKLAEKIGGEIISADSMQVYKYMDIGTAKITKEEMRGVPHHLIDVVEPSYRFSVSDYRVLADKTLADIEKRGAVPIITGGTGLYIQSLTEGLSDAPEGDYNLRRELELLSPEILYSRLVEADPETAANIHPNNRKKLVRALEVFLVSGKPISWFHKNTRKGNNFEFVKYGLELSREFLYDRINKRVDKMFDKGLIDEARYIYDNYRNCDTARQAIGYKELFDYFEGKTELSSAVEEIKQGSRNYAKRQFTWFRKENDIKWFNIETISADNVIEQIAAEFNGE